ncbi:hypothetical protein CEUSTIGMA_g5188.t1 [Chlamydomonas eustigma]|uniref:Uncharacterized protein n=1 Tax=Chlamydomonas eustigma TaxID=1157962 RepID=A0A250X3U2_9CHLO|nr:hypothetical protein CEUSTIGMA_g5188.t1 [Chlamydomonas eustigma]|eukprot:GAX77745.1 hypothetical protein CEUSTIGMA_g5188.t1 [Chlamydomonas eustigma]
MIFHQTCFSLLIYVLLVSGEISASQSRLSKINAQNGQSMGIECDLVSRAVQAIRGIVTLTARQEPLLTLNRVLGDTDTGRRFDLFWQKQKHVSGEPDAHDARQWLNPELIVLLEDPLLVSVCGTALNDSNPTLHSWIMHMAVLSQYFCLTDLAKQYFSVGHSCAVWSMSAASDREFADMTSARAHGPALVDDASSTAAAAAAAASTPALLLWGNTEVCHEKRQLLSGEHCESVEKENPLVEMSPSPRGLFEKLWCFYLHNISMLEDPQHIRNLKGLSSTQLGTAPLLHNRQLKDSSSGFSSNILAFVIAFPVIVFLCISAFFLWLWLYIVKPKRDKQAGNQAATQLTPRLVNVSEVVTVEDGSTSNTPRYVAALPQLEQVVVAATNGQRAAGMVNIQDNGGLDDGSSCAACPERMGTSTGNRTSTPTVTQPSDETPSHLHDSVATSKEMPAMEEVSIMVASIFGRLNGQQQDMLEQHEEAAPDLSLLEKELAPSHSMREEETVHQQDQQASLQLEQGLGIPVNDNATVSQGQEVSSRDYDLEGADAALEASLTAATSVLSEEVEGYDPTVEEKLSLPEHEEDPQLLPFEVHEQSKAKSAAAKSIVSPSTSYVFALPQTSGIPGLPSNLKYSAPTPQQENAPSYSPSQQLAPSPSPSSSHPSPTPLSSLVKGAFNKYGGTTDRNAGSTEFMSPTSLHKSGSGNARSTLGMGVSSGRGGSARFHTPATSKGSSYGSGGGTESHAHRYGPPVPWRLPSAHPPDSPTVFLATPSDVANSQTKGSGEHKSPSPASSSSKPPWRPPSAHPQDLGTAYPHNSSSSPTTMTSQASSHASYHKRHREDRSGDDVGTRRTLPDVYQEAGNDDYREAGNDEMAPREETPSLPLPPPPTTTVHRGASPGNPGLGAGRPS